MSGLKLFIRLILLPLSGIYRVIMEIRNRLYDQNIFKTVTINVPVISVGNITAGGTGKTPFVIALASWLSEAGYLPGIVTRGYRRQSKGQLVVRDRNAILSSPAEAGDEPYLIAANTKQTVVIADADRVAAAQTAVKEYACDIIIADDAFQHRRLGRDVDIVLWDSDNDPAGSAVLPAGRLRESIKGLRRADLLLISRTDSISTATANYFRKFNAKLLLSALPVKIRQISRLSDNEELPVSGLKNEAVLAFCGLGNPAQFFSTVEKITTRPAIRKTFPDHYKYSPTDLDQLVRQADKGGCRYLITTRKDVVNLPDSAKAVRSLLIIDIFYTIDEKVKAAILNKLPPRN